MPDLPELMTAAEAAAYVNSHVTAAAVSRAQAAQTLTGTRIGRQWYYTVPDVDAWLASMRVRPSSVGGLTPRSAAYHRNHALREQTR